MSGRLILPEWFENAFREPKVIKTGSQRWIANGALAIIIYGTLPRLFKQAREVHSTTVEKFERYCLSMSLPPVVSVGKTKRFNDEDNYRLVGKMPVDARYIKLVEQNFPCCTWHATGDLSSPAVACVGEKRVAFVMGIRLKPKGG